MRPTDKIENTTKIVKKHKNMKNYWRGCGRVVVSTLLRSSQQKNPFTGGLCTDYLRHDGNIKQQR